MLGISGVELPDRRPHPVSNLRLGETPHYSRRADPHPTGHRQSRVQLPNVATRVSHRQVQLLIRAIREETDNSARLLSAREQGIQVG